MKQCSKCEEVKDDNQFFKDTTSKDGLRCYCKDCYREINKKYQKIWYDKKGKEYGRKYRLLHAPIGYIPRKKREKLDNMGFSTATIWRYGRETLKELKETREWKCSRCGSTVDLTIHHIDHNGINFWKKKQYDKINNNIENLEIICRSCHGAIHTVEAGRKIIIKEPLWWLKIKRKRGTGRRKGFKHSKETRLKMRLARLGRKFK